MELFVNIVLVLIIIVMVIKNYRLTKLTSTQREVIDSQRKLIKIQDDLNTELKTHYEYALKSLQDIRVHIDKLKSLEDIESYIDETYGDDFNIQQTEVIYNVDDILEEINQKGVTNLSKDKLNFLKKYKK